MEVIITLALFLFIVAIIYLVIFFFLIRNGKGNDDVDKTTNNPFDYHDFI